MPSKSYIIVTWISNYGSESVSLDSSNEVINGSVHSSSKITFYLAPTLVNDSLSYIVSADECPFGKYAAGYMLSKIAYLNDGVSSPNASNITYYDPFVENTITVSEDITDSYWHLYFACCWTKAEIPQINDTVYNNRDLYVQSQQDVSFRGDQSDKTSDAYFYSATPFDLRKGVGAIDSLGRYVEGRNEWVGDWENNPYTPSDSASRLWYDGYSVVKGEIITDPASLSENHNTIAPDGSTLTGTGPNTHLTEITYIVGGAEEGPVLDYRVTSSTGVTNDISKTGTLDLSQYLSPDGSSSVSIDISPIIYEPYTIADITYPTTTNVDIAETTYYTEGVIIATGDTTLDHFVIHLIESS